MIHPPGEPFRERPDPLDGDGLLKLASVVGFPGMTIPHPLDVAIALVGVRPDHGPDVDVVPEEFLETVLLRVRDDPETEFLGPWFEGARHNPLVPRAALPEVPLVGDHVEPEHAGTLREVGAEAVVPLPRNADGHLRQGASLRGLVPVAEAPEEDPPLPPGELRGLEPGAGRERELPPAPAAVIAVLDGADIGCSAPGAVRPRTEDELPEPCSDAMFGGNNERYALHWNRELKSETSSAYLFHLVTNRVASLTRSGTCVAFTISHPLLRSLLVEALDCSPKIHSCSYDHKGCSGFRVQNRWMATSTSVSERSLRVEVVVMKVIS